MVDVVESITGVIITLEFYEGNTLTCDLTHLLEADEASEYLVELILRAGLRQLLNEEDLVGLGFGSEANVRVSKLDVGFTSHCGSLLS